jgi:UDP-N-acetylmuramate-alanine ligase
VQCTLALALHNKGYKVTGSDDAIFEPSQSRLDKKRDIAFRNGLVLQNHK